jgi:hypothetical protein
MRFGIHLPQIGRKAGPEAIRRAAVQAEELGFDDVWTTIPAVVDGMRSLPRPGCRDGFPQCGPPIPRRCQRGIFAAKIQFDQYFTELKNPVGRQLLDGGLFIHLFREDLLRQAVSYNFSFATGRWGDDDIVTTTAMAQSGLLDARGIDREKQTLADEDREWRVLLSRNGLAPMSISYEQLCKDPSRFVEAIACRIGIDPDTLRQGYSEPVTTSREDAPALPTEVL